MLNIFVISDDAVDQRKLGMLREESVTVVEALTWTYISFWFYFAALHCWKQSLCYVYSYHILRESYDIFYRLINFFFCEIVNWLFCLVQVLTKSVEVTSFDVPSIVIAVLGVNSLKT